MRTGLKLQKPVTQSLRKRPVSCRLSSPFCRCPVCGGTTTLDSQPGQVPRRLFSICYSCDTRWDLRGELISMGRVVRLPLMSDKRYDQQLY